MPFVKLDTGILRSTLWLDKPGRDIFITALLLAEPQQLETTTEQINVRNLDGTGFMIPPGWYGFVAAAGPYLVHAAGVSEEEGFQALERLGSPEDESRSKDFGGRRLVRVDGGYLVLNYFKYRDHDYTAAERMRRLRARRNVTPNSDAVTANGRNEALSGDAVRANVTHSREQRQRQRHTTTDNGLQAAPAGWNTEAADDFKAQYGGNPPAQFFAQVKPVVTKHGWDTVRPVLKAVLEETPLEYLNLPKVLGVRVEAAKAGVPQRQQRKAGASDDPIEQNRRVLEKILAQRGGT